MVDKNNSLSLTFSALADPTRRGILAMLSAGERTVTELFEFFDLSQPAISKHLKVLERAGLVERGREAQWRPAKLQAEPLKEVFAWVEQYRQYWEPGSDQQGETPSSLESEQQSGDGEEVDQPPKTQARDQSDWQMF